MIENVMIIEMMIGLGQMLKYVQEKYGKDFIKLYDKLDKIPD